MTPSTFRTLLSPVLRRSTAATSILRPSTTSSIVPRRFAHSDYGSPDGNPAGEKPQDQGPNPSEHLEHPGPPAPDVGQKKSGNASESKKDSGSSSSSGSGKKEEGGESTSSSSSTSASSEKSNNNSLGEDSTADEGRVTAKNGAKPKFNTEPPKDVDQAEVDKHNKEIDERQQKNAQGGREVSEKVGKGFWSGKFARFLLGVPCCGGGGLCCLY